MDLVNSYKVKILNVNKSLDMTLSIYREAVAYLIDVINSEWSNIVNLKNKEKNNFIEDLVHSTKFNSAIYDFDSLFYKFPSYLRRSAIADALGIVSSYYSNLDNYNKERYETISSGKKFKKQEPKLNLKHYKCPAFYKGNMFIPVNSTEVKIKVFNGKDWIWFTVNLRYQDVKYIENNCKGGELSPILFKKGRVYYLRFSFNNKVTLNKTPLKEQKIVAVDLGLNTTAVCSLLDFKGTVIDRLFVNQPIEKDRQNHLLNRLRLKNKQGGKYAKNKKLWNKINNLNTEITNKTVNEIVNFAVFNNADVIVFEYLDIQGKKPKNISQKLQMWAKRDIQNKVMHKAHNYGIRVNRVNPRNTSKLAFDGSGLVKRDISNYSLCTFTTGKQYNSDLNASYNIGARYFIGEINKTTPIKEWSLVKAKVPSLELRTQSTLSTLISLVAVM